MAEPDVPLSFLVHEKIAPHATSRAPAWLWSRTGELLWANAAAMRPLGASTLELLKERCPAALLSAGRQIERIAPTLPYAGPPRLERLRDLGAGIGSAAVYACVRIKLADNSPALLVVSADRLATGELSLAERVEGLLAGASEPVAAYTAEGLLLFLGEAAAERIGDAQSLKAIQADALGAEALRRGRAEGDIPLGRILIHRLGEQEDAALLLRLPRRSAGGAAAPVMEDELSARPCEGTVGAPDAPTAPRPAPLAPTWEDPARKGVERRQPLRFVWRTDAQGHFTLASTEFAELVGGQTPRLIGRTWAEIAAALELDPAARVECAIASHDTFTGISVAWPTADYGRVAVELSGLPTFDRQRSFSGYRGFGVCRDVGRVRRRVGDNESTHSLPSGEAVAASDSFEPAQPKPGPESRPTLSVVPPAKNVVPFRGSPGAADKRPLLTPVERTAFREIARALGAKAEGEEPSPTPELPAPGFGKPAPPVEPPPDEADARIPAGSPAPADERRGEEAAIRAARLAEAEARELRSILDTATDGVIVLDRNGSIVSLNRSGEALFGYEATDVIGQPFADLFAPESRRAALDYFDGLTSNGVASLLNDGREVIGRVRQGGLVPLFMTLGRVNDAGEKYCVVLRDITQWKRAEEELLNAKRLAEKSSSAKSDFLAKISHEIRTPLNAIIGFSEVMMEQRFGPIANERYREYLRDIHASGEHVMSLVNDLLDLSKIEAGKLDLTFTSVQLNELVQQCVALMQPQANRERIIIRTSLMPSLPPVVVDARSIRQIMLNLLSNSIKFTGAGGQVIVSTAFTESAEVILRVRDTGVGMSDEDIAKAMEPFRQLATSSRWRPEGTGLGLPLTKALAEANRASFAIKSAVNSGTLIEITFPATRVLAE